VPAADGFVPLAAWLGLTLPLAADPPAALAAAPPPEAPPPEPPPPPPETLGPPAARPEAELLRDVRLFRARLADALDAAAVQLTRELAYAVLGRELRLAPADVGALAARLLAEHAAAEPVEIRHAPGERPDLPVPCVADPALEPGDLVVAFREGSVDARFGVRLAVLLEAWA